MSEIKVSICCLAYNHEKYIAEALESLARQKTDFPFEVICNDDASTDSTPYIIEEYAKKYPSIIKPVFQADNQRKNGGNVVWNTFYPKAQGKYIAYCDGDDFWITTDRLEKQVGFLESHPDYSLCLTGYYLLLGNKRRLAQTNLPEGEVPVEKIIMWKDCPPQLSTAMFRKEDAVNRPELFRKIGGEEGSLLPISDLPLFVYLSLIGKVYYSSEPTSIWRRHGAAWGYSGSRQERARFREDEADFFEKLNIYTNHQFQDVINEKVIACKALAASSLGDYKKAAQLQKGHPGILSKRRQMVNTLGAYFPNLAHSLETMKTKIETSR